MKTTLEIPDPLFRQSKAMAALRGQTLKDFVSAALRAYLEPADSASSGWRSVFGKARSEEVEGIDAIIAEEFGHVDAESWQ